MLLDHLVAYCDNSYRLPSSAKVQCTSCTHPTRCKGNCKQCLDEVHWLKAGGRDDYECENLLFFYTCKYSYKYCSEIIHAIKKVEINNYPVFNILSLGCGPAPDLMAFEYITNRSDNKKSIKYRGYDRNTLWENIHDEIENYSSRMMNNNVKFRRKDVFDALLNDKPRNNYNIMIIQYLISHLYNTHQHKMIDKLYDNIIKNVVSHKRSDSPFLIIINDIDSIKKGRNSFWPLADKLSASGFTTSASAWSFNSNCYLEKSQQHFDNYNQFSIPENIKNNYECAISCSSAQLIIGVW